MDVECTTDLSHYYRQFELKFSCAICWNAKLRMIYGSCQHRFCEDCVYDPNGTRKTGLERCPSCQQLNSLPEFRPDIPEDNVEVQMHLGVRKCPNSGCGFEMWHWEYFGHLASCKFGTVKEDSKSQRKQETKISQAASLETPELKKERNTSHKRKKKRKRKDKICNEYLLRSGKKRRAAEMNL